MLIMNKKTIIFLCLIIFLVGVYYFFYQRPSEDDETAEPSLPIDGRVEIPDCQECGALISVVIDGLLQKIENNIIYLQPKDRENPLEAVNLTEATTFSEMIFSSEGELLEQKDISLVDLEEGNQVSIAAFYYEDKPEDKTASAVRRIEGIEIIVGMTIDGVFQRTENDFLYIRPQEGEGSEQAIKLTEATTFSEMVFSSERELLEQKDINLADLKEGNQVSIAAFYYEDKLEDKTASSVRRIVVEASE